jgi:hypothetical protein
VRSISDWIVRTTPDAQRPKKLTGPVATAVFIAVLAAGMTGGTMMLANSVSHNNAAAYSVADNAEAD